jgi:hypothetical protein
VPKRRGGTGPMAYAASRTSEAVGMISTYPFGDSVC